METWLPTVINLFMLAVTALMAWLMNKTFRTGQKQTEISLAINQYHIYYLEFKDYVEEAKNLKFGDESDILSQVGIKDIKERFNGINYIPTFLFAPKLHKYLVQKPEKELIDGFRFGVIFPLTRYYDRLFEFLQRIKNDEVLSNNYQRILFMHVEKELLQTYFRVCNHRFGNTLWYDIEPLKTDAFDHGRFYEINQFYIKHNLFQFKPLAFYIQNT